MSQELELDEEMLKPTAQKLRLPLRQKTVSVKKYNRIVATKAKTTKPILYNLIGILVLILVVVLLVGIL